MGNSLFYKKPFLYGKEDTVQSYTAQSLQSPKASLSERIKSITKEYDTLRSIEAQIFRRQMKEVTGGEAPERIVNAMAEIFSPLSYNPRSIDFIIRHNKPYGALEHQANALDYVLAGDRKKAMESLRKAHFESKESSEKYRTLMDYFSTVYETIRKSCNAIEELREQRGMKSLDKMLHLIKPFKPAF